MLSLFDGAPLSMVDLRRPVNKAHPLNRGRVFWWLALPQLASGPTLFDLVGRNHGTMIGGTSGDGWVASTGRNGLAAFRNRTTTNGQIVKTSMTSDLRITYPLSFAVSVRVLASASSISIFGTNYDGSNSVPYTPYRLDTFSGQLYVKAIGTSANYSPFATGVSFGNSGITPWTRFLAVINPGGISFYQNGKLVASDSVSRGPTSYAATAQISWASYAAGGASNNIDVDDATVWNRALTASEIQQDYLLASTGYPLISGVLNPTPIIGAWAVPAAPTGLSGTAGNQQVTLTWTAVSGATSYNVYYGTVNGGPYTLFGNVGTNTATVTGLTNGTLYYFVVTAINPGGESANSNQASATPVAPVTGKKGGGLAFWRRVAIAE